MSKTTPVRWWRDDATRFRSRPPYICPLVEEIKFNPPPPISPEALAWIDAMLGHLIPMAFIKGAKL